jgi:hypothetical protein
MNDTIDSEHIISTAGVVTETRFHHYLPVFFIVVITSLVQLPFGEISSLHFQGKTDDSCLLLIFIVQDHVIV